MIATRPFQLEPTSPEDRADRQAERRKGIREAMARARAEARAAGATQITVFIEQDRAVAPGAAANCAKMKRGELAIVCAERIAGRGWLPPALRARPVFEAAAELERRDGDDGEDENGGGEDYHAQADAREFENA